MKKTLLKKGITKYIAGLVIIMLLIFLPAGSLKYANGWLFIGLLFIPMLIMGVVLFVKNPTLLEKRLNVKENESEQKGVVAISGIMFLVGFIVAGLNYRFDWWTLPKFAVIAASVVFIASYAMYAEVLRENTYLSRTVEIQEEQKVIDTGLYGVVRHPMYTATILMFLAIPLILGSFWAFLIFLLYPLTIVLRIDNEEQVLENGLAGYSDYKKKVKYRIIPYIW